MQQLSLINMQHMRLSRRWRLVVCAVTHYTMAISLTLTLWLVHYNMCTVQQWTNYSKLLPPSDH